MSNGFRTRAATAAWALMVAAAAPGLAQAQEGGTLGGTAIPGLCVLGQPAVLANSKIGQAATARLRELEQSNGAGVNAERQSLQADANALNAQRASLPPAELQKREQALAQRAEAYQAKANTLNRQLEATRIKAVSQISQVAQPVVAQVYQAHGCGMLLSREIVLGGNLANDLTPDVVKGLDAKQSTITFELEPPPSSAGAAPAASQ